MSGRTSEMVRQAIEQAALGKTTLILTITEEEAVCVRKLVGPVRGVTVRRASAPFDGKRCDIVHRDAPAPPEVAS